MLCGIGAAVVPQAAYAQDGYYGYRNDYGYRGDRDWDRHQAREWRERERQERRAEEWRERNWRRNEWRAEEWRDRGRDYRYDRAYPQGYFEYGYRR